LTLSEQQNGMKSFWTNSPSGLEQRPTHQSLDMTQRPVCPEYIAVPGEVRGKDASLGLLHGVQQSCDSNH